MSLNVVAKLLVLAPTRLTASSCFLAAIPPEDLTDLPPGFTNLYATFLCFEVVDKHVAIDFLFPWHKVVYMFDVPLVVVHQCKVTLIV